MSHTELIEAWKSEHLGDMSDEVVSAGSWILARGKQYILGMLMVQKETTSNNHNNSKDNLQ